MVLVISSMVELRLSLIDRALLARMRQNVEGPLAMVVARVVRLASSPSMDDEAEIGVMAAMVMQIASLQSCINV
jgi:hypothetical protein